MNTSTNGSAEKTALVTGAAGHLGRAVVENLLTRMAADRIAASVRDPAKAADFARRGVDVRAGDFADPTGLAQTFAGAQQVLIVSVDKVGETALGLHRAAIEAARAAGARRVLYTSQMGARPDSAFAPAHDHAATEEFMAGLGVPFTSLRHGFYAESALLIIGHGLEAGEIRAPEDGPVSWTTRADLAEADATILADEGRFDGISPALTALEAFTLDDVAAIASEISGREIKRVTVADDEWIESKVAQGVPAPMAQMLLGMFVAARRGDFAVTDPTLENLLGRRPQTMRDTLAAVLKPAQS